MASLDVGPLQHGSGLDVGPLQSASTSVLTIAQNENFNFTDSTTLILSLLLSISDSISLSDGVALQTGNITVADQLVFSDSATIVLDLEYNFNDAISLGDSAVDIVVVIVQIMGDSLTLTDSLVVTPFAVITLQVSDGLTLSDSFQEFTSNPLRFNDSLTFQDLVQLSALTKYSFNDQLNIIDTVQIVLIPIANLTPSDSINLSDAIAIQLNSIFTPINLSFNDSISMQDGIGHSAIPETIVLSDSFMFNDSCTLVLISYITPYLRRYLNDVVGTSNP